MKRRPASRRGLALTPALCLLALAACGGSSVEVGVPPDLNGPVVSGLVSLPNGEVTSAPSALDRLAQVVVAKVEALAAVDVDVLPVGPGVEVRLMQIDDRNIVDGQIRNARELFKAVTDDNGQYAVRLPTGSSPGDCRFYLEVGNTAVTRAFIYAAEPTSTNVSFESEATVRLLLDEIRAGNTTLCSLDAADIQIVDIAVTGSPNDAFGTSIAALNASAAIAAAADPNVQRAIAIAIGAVTPGPTVTNTAAVVATATATVSATGTAAPPTSTSGVPTATNTRALRTATSTATETGAPPTRTPTVGTTATSTAAASNTTAPTNTTTPTNTTAPSNTAGPTSTATVGPSNTAAPTSTRTNAPPATATTTAVATASVPPATNTAASTPTQTVAATPTATAAQIDLGVAAGTAGGVVSLPVTLVTNGAAISAVSNDITYDAAEVDVVTVAGVPDCTIDNRLSGAKQVVADVAALTGTRKRLRVGVIGATNNSTITSGPLYSCRFALTLGAPSVVTLLNLPEASSPQGNVVNVIGTDGGITAAPAAASLGLAAGAVAGDGTVTITASVNGRGQALAAVATDIRFDPDQLTAVDEDQNGEPDCTVPAAVAGLGKELFATVLAAGDQSVLRLGLVATDNNTALPETGGPVALFGCRFDVQATATTIVVQHAPEGAGPGAQTIPLLGEPATIVAP